MAYGRSPGKNAMNVMLVTWRLSLRFLQQRKHTACTRSRA